MEESSQAEPNIGTHSPFGIAVVKIPHEGRGLDLSVNFYGREDTGAFKSPPCPAGGSTAVEIADARTDRTQHGDNKTSCKGGGTTDTDLLVSPFNFNRDALVEGVAEGRCKTGSSFQTETR